MAATRAKHSIYLKQQKSNRRNPWEPLLEFVNIKEDAYDIPDVQTPKQKPSEALAEIPVELSKEDFDSFKRQTELFIAMQKPTYIEMSVSDIISDEPLHTVKGGLGPQWGMQSMK